MQNRVHLHCVQERLAGAWKTALVVAALLATALFVAPAHPVQAAPVQQAAVQSIFLGEYVFQSLNSGDTLVYEVEIAEAGVYLVTAVDEVNAVAFDMSVTADGTTIFDDTFGTTELELEAGTVTFEFVALDDAGLEFVVLGQIGTMTTDDTAPGKLPTGGIYTADLVSNPQYAILSVPDTTYPQEVLLYAEAGPEDEFFVNAEGDDIGFVSINTTETDLLRFWTHGGDYLISADPLLRRSRITLIPFLSGPPASVTVGESMEGIIPAGSTEVVYALPLDTTYDELAIELTGSEELSFTLLDRLYDSGISENSFGESTLSLQTILPGSYYVLVETITPLQSETPFTILVTGTEGAPLATLESGVEQVAEMEAGVEAVNYEFNVTQPGALVTVGISSDVPDSDFDLDVGLRPGTGDAIWSSFELGSEDQLSFVAPVSGTYYIAVLSNGDAGELTVTAVEGDLAPSVTVNGLLFGTVLPLSSDVYRLEITEPDQLLSVALIGGANVDLDLRVVSYNAQGDTNVFLSGYSGSSAEIVSQSAVPPGIYEVTVNSSFDEGSSYFLLTELLPAYRVAGQWAESAVASSENGEDDYSAGQATGAPTIETAGDNPAAWTSLDPDAGEETLELSYAFPVVPYAVEIYESFNPGAIVTIEAYDAETDTWVAIWEGEGAPAEEEIRTFSPDLTQPDFATDTIRLVLDTTTVTGWNEIDAVQLFGLPR